jgi:hypothetical protein
MKRMLLVVGIMLAVGLFAVGCKKEEPTPPTEPAKTEKVAPAATEAVEKAGEAATEAVKEGTEEATKAVEGAK